MCRSQEWSSRFAVGQCWHKSCHHPTLFSRPTSISAPNTSCAGRTSLFLNPARFPEREFRNIDCAFLFDLSKLQTRALWKVWNKTVDVLKNCLRGCLNVAWFKCEWMTICVCAAGETLCETDCVPIKIWAGWDKQHSDFTFWIKCFRVVLLNAQVCNLMRRHRTVLHFA